MRLPGRHVLYALSAVTMLAACSSNGARGGIASTNMNPTNHPQLRRPLPSHRHRLRRAREPRPGLTFKSATAWPTCRRRI